MNKQYIGDGVYAEFEDNYTIVLTTENGIQVTNRIVLEAEVLNNLNNYIKEFYYNRKKFAFERKING